MSNLTELYTESMTIPVSRVYEGMLLMSLGHENKSIQDGTVFKVIEKLSVCNENTLCNNDFFVNDCCRCGMIIGTVDKNPPVGTTACYCSLVTMDGRLVVSD